MSKWQITKLQRLAPGCEQYWMVVQDEQRCDEVVVELGPGEQGRLQKVWKLLTEKMKEVALRKVVVVGEGFTK